MQHRVAQNLCRFGCQSLIADAREQLVPAEHLEHIEDAGRGRPAGERGAERLRDLAELQACLLGICPHGRIERLRRPGLDAFKLRQQRAEDFAPGLVEQLLGLRIEGEGRLAKR